MANHLLHESSPYLLQHVDNPVEWYPWCDEAWDRARRENKPVFLSIGYSACHWCHVMERESFEDPDLAQLLNEHFVCIKVDREERPDVDQIYMTAVQLMTGRGGWPMSVFLTPEGKPFFGGTYWPPVPRHGMPSFGEVLRAVVQIWRERNDQAFGQAEMVTSHIRKLDAPGRVAVPADRGLFTQIASDMLQVADLVHGGFGSAPKFPQPSALEFLLRYAIRKNDAAALDFVRLTLDHMAAGGMYDHLGGGFARYSVDERWLVPHFEKMLYDNAQLATLYVDAYVATGKPHYAAIGRHTLDYVLRDMTDPSGGFHSAEDADSEGEEGKFYLWTRDEIQRVLGAEAGDRFCYVYDVSREGNFEGRNILNLPRTISQSAALRNWDVKQLEAELARGRAELEAARRQRIRPAKDDKILLSWNGLMIHAFARGGIVFEQEKYVEAAVRAGEFLRGEFRRDGRQWYHSWRRGTARFDAYLDDYANWLNALITLYEATCDESWLETACEIADILLRQFVDPEGGFFYTSTDHEPLIARPKDFQDGAVPSGNAMAARGLLRLNQLIHNNQWLEAVEGVLRAGLTLATQAPLAAPQLLNVLDMVIGPMAGLVVVGDPHRAGTRRLLNELRSSWLPDHVVACRPPTRSESAKSPLDDLFAGKTTDGAEPSLWLCHGGTCDEPAHGVAESHQRWLAWQHQSMTCDG